MNRARPNNRPPRRSGPAPRTRDAASKESAEAARQSPAENALQTRAAAAALVAEVLKSGQSLDDCLARMVAGLDARDMGLMRAITLVSFGGLARSGTRCRRAWRAARRKAARSLMRCLVTAAAQILFLDVPDHAAVDCAVTLAGEDRRHAHKRGFVNALLRRIAREKDAILTETEADPLIDLPDWLAGRWQAHYGGATAVAMARAQRLEPPLDVSAKADPALWAERLGARLLPTGSLRLQSHDAIETLSGFSEGAWWVQDAAASLPAQLLGDVTGLDVADLCAAPGGKTMQLAARGARVTAVGSLRPAHGAA